MTLHKASGQARVKIKRRDHYLGPYGSPEAQAKYDRLIAAHLASGRQAVAPERSLLLLEHLADIYLREFAAPWYRKGDRQTSRFWVCRRSIEMLYAAGLAEGYPDQFTPAHLERFQSYLAESDRYARQTINEFVSVVVDLFRWAVAQGYVHETVWRSLQAVRPLRKGRPAPGTTVRARESRRVTAPPAAALEAMIQKLSPTVAAMARLQSISGLRPGALVGMRRGDLSPIPGHAAKGARAVWLYRPSPEASKLDHVEMPEHQRTVVLGPRSMAVLAPLLKGLAPEDFIFSPRRVVEAAMAERSAGRQSPRWPSHSPEARKARRKRSENGPMPGDQYTVDSYRRALARASEAAGVPRIAPNQLRHYAATVARASGNLEAAQALLGHASKTTTEIYAELPPAVRIEAAMRLG